MLSTGCPMSESECLRSRLVGKPPLQLYARAITRVFDFGCIAIGIPSFAMLLAKEPIGVLFTVAFGSIAVLAWRVQQPRRKTIPSDTTPSTTRQTGVGPGLGQPFPAR